MPTTLDTPKRHDIDMDSDDYADSGRVAFGTLRNEFRNLIADIEDFIVSSTSLTDSQLDQARTKVRARIEAAKKTMTTAGDTAWLRARQSAKATDKYVHEQPWTAVGIGVAVGLLTGLIFTRRND